MLFSGYAFIGTYRAITDFRNTLEGNHPNTPLPFAIRLQYIYSVIVALLELIIIFYLLKDVMKLQASFERTVKIVLVILVPELYALFNIFGTPQKQNDFSFSNLDLNTVISDQKYSDIQPVHTNLPKSQLQLLFNKDE